jgi:uncharacterized protein (DUF305 family)
MTANHTRRTIALLVAAVALSACTGATSGGNTAPSPRENPHAELEAIYRARLDSARLRFTEADVRFMTRMIAHHAQALVMTRLVPTHDASPEIGILAGRIVNAQRDEIALMQRWLRDRGKPVPELQHGDQAAMPHDAGHDAHMPGMLTAEQLAELDRARGAAFDSLFLTYMIQHHRGAVTMVHDLFATDGAGQDEAVFRLASDVQVDQATEIARMERMLAELPPDDRSP